MKRFYKLYVCWVSVLLLVFSPSMQSHASLGSLLIRTDSNALMTMELGDSDYAVMPMSSIGTVTNTVDWSDDLTVRFALRHVDTGNYVYAWRSPTEILDNGFRIRYSAPSDYYISQINVYGVSNYDSNIPPSGIYSMTMDVSSSFAHEIDRVRLGSQYAIDNAERIESLSRLPFVQSSGDIYIGPANIKINPGISLLSVYWGFNSRIYEVDYTISQSYVLTSNTDGLIETASPNLSSEQNTENYQNNVSSSLSDLSSSVDEVNEGISGITEAIENLQGAMEPHYNNVLTQLHHITEQLHAFYDQVYNNIHLPELSMLTQIKTAIENIDLQIEVDISEVKTAINNMSTAVQNKLQSTTDQIMNGYDNSGIVQENEKLEQSINDYDMVESEIFDEAGGFVGEFEYPSVDSLSGGVIKALAFVGSFLQGVFLSMGDFSSIITFSLTMIFVMVVVGYHRIRS